ALDVEAKVCRGCLQVPEPKVFDIERQRDASHRGVLIRAQRARHDSLQLEPSKRRGDEALTRWLRLSKMDPNVAHRAVAFVLREESAPSQALTKAFRVVVFELVGHPDLHHLSTTASCRPITGDRKTRREEHHRVP